MSGVELLFGLIPSAFKTAVLGKDVYQSISELAQKYRDAPHAISDLVDQLKTRHDDIRTKAEAAKFDHPEIVRKVILKHQSESTKLITILTQLPTIPNDGKASKILRTRAALTWWIKDQQIRKRLEGLNQTRTELCYLLLEARVEGLRLPGVSLRGTLTGGAAEQTTQSVAWPKAMAIKQVFCTLPARNKYFVGQRQRLQLLEEKLCRKEGDNQVAVIGLSGNGKSELVKEYAYQRAAANPSTSIFLVRAYTEEEFEQSYLEIASAVSLQVRIGENVTTWEDVRDFLESSKSGSWILIVDGADDNVALSLAKKQGRLPKSSSDRAIIFTSQDRRLMLDFVRRDGIIYLDGLDSEDAQELLVTTSEDRKAGKEDIVKLLDILNYMPLAIVQAASFISKNDISIQEYLPLFQANEHSMLELLSEEMTSCHQGTIKPLVLALLLSIGRIRQESEIAIHFLFYLACLHPESIRKPLLPTEEDPIKTTKAFGALKGYSVITSDSTDTFTMHRLIRLVARGMMQKEGKFADYVELVHSTIYDLFPQTFGTKDDLELGRLLAPHAQALLDEETRSFLQSLNGEHPLLSELVARYFRAQGMYQSALTYAQIGTEQSISAFGEQSLSTLSCLQESGLCYQALGEFTNAEEILDDVLARREIFLGVENTATMESMRDKARNKFLQGKYEDAEKACTQLLALQERSHPKQDPELLKTLTNLGIALQSQQKYDEAEKAFRQVLRSRTETLGAKDVSTLTAISNLGTLQQLRGHWDDALASHNLAFEGRCEILGPDHHETLKSRANRILAYEGQQKWQDAEKEARLLLQSFTDSLGSYHPDTLTLKSNIAMNLHNQSRIREAEKLSREVFEDRKATLGPEHPYTIYSQSHADGLADWLEKYGSSLPLCRETID